MELAGEGEFFLLQVRGDSMIDAAIIDGDWMAVRTQPNAEDGDVVVGMIDGEAVVKALRRGGRPGLADAAERRVSADPRREGHRWWQGSCRAALRLTCQMSRMNGIWHLPCQPLAAR